MFRSGTCRSEEGQKGSPTLTLLTHPQGRYDILPITDDMEWVPAGYGELPKGRRPVEGVRNQTHCARTFRSSLDVPDSPTRTCRVSSRMAVISTTLSLQSTASKYRERLALIWQVPHTTRSPLSLSPSNPQHRKVLRLLTPLLRLTARRQLPLERCRNGLRMRLQRPLLEKITISNPPFPRVSFLHHHCFHSSLGSSPPSISLLF